MHLLKGSILVGTGGAVGTALRYCVSLSGMAPHAIFIVNMLGCLLIGILTAVCHSRHSLSPEMRLLTITGFCGGFTTYSAFSFEMLQMLQNGQPHLFIGYLLGSLLIGVWMVAMGMAIVKRFNSSQNVD